MKLPISTTKIGYKLSQVTKKQWIIAAVVLVILVAAVLYYLYKKGKLFNKAATSDGEAKIIQMPTDGKAHPFEPAAPLFSNCPDDSFPLKYGKCGKRVEQFQLYLVKQYGAQFSTYGIDGKWGDETEAIAKKFILKNEPFSISEDYFNKTGMYAYSTIKYA